MPTTKRQREPVNLTTGRARRVLCEDGRQQDFWRDIGVRGLAVRVTAAGNRAYVFESKLDGKTIRLTIGDPESITISQAREEAIRLRAMIMQGRDPRIVKQELTAADSAKRQKNRSARTPAIDAWHDYLTARARHWSARTLRDHQRLIDPGGKKKTRGRKKGEGDKTLPGALYSLLQLPLSKIDSEAVQAWLIAQDHRPAVARVAFVRLRAFLNWCADRPQYRDHVIPDACTATAVTDEVPKARAKDDSLERQHLKLWFEYVRKLDNPVHAAYLQTVLLTGARREEIAAMKWADIDFKWRRIEIADKVEGNRVIPLPPYLASLLLDLQRINNTPPNVRQLTRLKENNKEWKPSQWVFASPRAASGYIQEPRAAHNKILKLAGLPHVSIHGLRRSFGSLTQWSDIPAGVIPQIQGHKPSATAEKHYRVRPIDLLYKWHSEYERWILEQAGIDQPEAGADKIKPYVVAV